MLNICRWAMLLLWFFVSATIAASSIRDFSNIPAVLERRSDIGKPVDDKRDYRFLVLGNRMQVILIKDDQAPKDVVYLGINGGSLEDPRDMYGMAHFLEHSVFLGSENYPGEQDFAKFMKSKGGRHNAATAFTKTTYYFDLVPGPHIIEGVKRLTDFIVSPNLKASSVSRELKAVNSEWKGNTQSDFRRQMQIFCSAANPDHPYNSFFSGNTKSVRRNRTDAQIAERLKQYHSTHYSSNLMAIVITTKTLSLDELESGVLDTLLTIPDLNLPKPVYDYPFRQRDLGKLIKMETVSRSHKLKVYFQMDDPPADMKVNPQEYFTSLIGHEGPESLLQEVKRQGLVDTLVTKKDNTAPGINHFEVSFNLTPKGLERWKTIMRHLFEYIKMLKTTVPSQRYWNEILKRQRMSFQNQDHVTSYRYAKQIVDELLSGRKEKDRILAGPPEDDGYDQEKMQQMMNGLNAKNMIVFLISPTFRGKTERIEPWYGGRYNISDIETEFIEELDNISPKPYFRIPEPNIFFPDGFEIENQFDHLDDTSKHPNLVLSREELEIWHHQDMRFNKPKTHVELNIRNPAFIGSLRTYMTTKLYIELLMDQFPPHLYPASLAGITWNLDFEYRPWDSGIVLTVFGYSESIPKVLNKIAELIESFEPSPTRFEQLREGMIQKTKNFDTLEDRF